MATDKQIEANRLNAQKSTGPRTPEGKAASSQNAIIHGLRARAVVLPGEDQQAFDELLQSLRGEYQPQAASEDLLVQQAAITWWKLTRLAAIEQTAWRDQIRSTQQAGYFQHRREDLAEENREQEFPLSEDLLLHAFQGNGLLEHLAQQQYRLDRAFQRTLRELQRLQAARRRQVPEKTTPKELPQREPVGQVPGLPAQNLDERTQIAPVSQVPDLQNLDKQTQFGPNGHGRDDT
jgi:hypothetical protein